MRQNKRKQRIIGSIIGIFVVIIAIVGINYSLDKTLNDMTDLFVVKSEGLDIQKPLEEQTDLLGTEAFKTLEVKKMKGKYVTHIEQIKGKKLNRTIEVGHPIPLDALEDIK
ncbi:hypothetical protein [Peribacillus sp. Hz7]|uniref:hypothetical protein n=1 Tax=Peribacillus sp. Hz7 TaxID=3344873 RepID=UPI0035CC2695